MREADGDGEIRKLFDRGGVFLSQPIEKLIRVFAVFAIGQTECHDVRQLVVRPKIREEIRSRRLFELFQLRERLRLANAASRKDSSFDGSPNAISHPKSPPHRRGGFKIARLGLVVAPASASVTAVSSIVLCCVAAARRRVIAKVVDTTQQLAINTSASDE